MIRRLLIETEVGDAKPNECGTCLYNDAFHVREQRTV